MNKIRLEKLLTIAKQKRRLLLKKGVLPTYQRNTVIITIDKVVHLHNNTVIEHIFEDNTSRWCILVLGAGQDCSHIYSSEEVVHFAEIIWEPLTSCQSPL